MKVFKLADAPLDVDPLEYELLRSVTNPVGQAAAGAASTEPLSAAASRPLPSPANQSTPPAAPQPRPAAGPLASAVPPSQPLAAPSRAPLASEPAPATATFQPILRPAAPAATARPLGQPASRAPLSKPATPAATQHQPTLRPAAPTGAARPVGQPLPRTRTPLANPAAPAASQPALRPAAPSSTQASAALRPAAALQSAGAVDQTTERAAAPSPTPPVANPATAAQTPPVEGGASLLRYDWDAPIEISERTVPVPPSFLDRTTQAYRQVAEKTAWLQAIPPRRLALGIAGIALLAGIGAGMTLLSDPQGNDAVQVAAAQAPAAETTVETEPTPDAASEDLASAPTAAPAPEATAPAPVAEAAPAAPSSASAALVQPQASAPQQVSPAATPELNDDRWGPATAGSSFEEPVDTAASDSGMDESRRADAAPSDNGTTGSIVPVDPAPAKPAPSKSRAARPAKAKPAAAAPEPAAPVQTASSGITPGNAQVTTAVKMRAGPDNDADVVKVVPTNGSVDVISCKVWCKVSFDGQEGYIFKRFIKQDG